MKRPDKLRQLLLILILPMLACQLTSGQLENTVTAVPPAETISIAVPTTIPENPTPTLAISTPTTAAVPIATTVPAASAVPPTDTAVPTLTNTPLPWTERAIIGSSIQGRPIEVVRLGTGDRWFVVLAAMHGAHECNTNSLAEGLINRLTAEPSLLPADVTLYMLPLINPDGCATNSRYNANGVDLNRNWAAADWTADAEGPAGIIAGSGGAFPFSEPETAALQSWLLGLKQQSPDGTLQVISYHSVVSTGLAQPAYAIYGTPEPRSEALAMQYAEVTGYLYSAVWVGTYTITGEFIHWAGENDIIAFDVELPDRNTADSIPVGWNETHIETNLRGLLAVMAWN